MGNRRWAVETRPLTPAEVRLVFELLEQLGHDPAAVGELKIAASPFGGLDAEITHRAEPGRIIVPIARPELIVAKR